MLTTSEVLFFSMNFLGFLSLILLLAGFFGSVFGVFIVIFSYFLKFRGKFDQFLAIREVGLTTSFMGLLAFVAGATFHGFYNLIATFHGVIELYKTF